jgi:DNA-binding GntR family transcriptional regulator
LHAGADAATLAEAAAQAIRASILDGRLKPGERIGQEAIAAELGISRIPVREALSRLEAEGLVAIRPHSGARVVLLDFEECVEIYKMREQIEPLALSESAVHLSDEQIERVAALADRLPALLDDHGAWLDGDRQFHLAGYVGAPGTRVVRLIVDYWNSTQRYRRVLLTTFTEDDFALAHAEHALIVDALSGRRADAAAAHLRLALERSRLRLTANRHLFDV